MDYDLSQTCDLRESRFDCPDAPIAVMKGGYGMIVHDGGSSVIEINFCPWCGSKLPGMGSTSDSEDPVGQASADADL
jgi:hypothetical protein